MKKLLYIITLGAITLNIQADLLSETKLKGSVRNDEQKQKARQAIQNLIANIDEEIQKNKDEVAEKRKERQELKSVDHDGLVGSQVADMFNDADKQQNEKEEIKKQQKNT